MDIMLAINNRPQECFCKPSITDKYNPFLSHIRLILLCFPLLNPLGMALLTTVLKYWLPPNNICFGTFFPSSNCCISSLGLLNLFAADYVSYIDNLILSDVPLLSSLSLARKHFTAINAHKKPFHLQPSSGTIFTPIRSLEIKDMMSWCRIRYSPPPPASSPHLDNTQVTCRNRYRLSTFDTYVECLREIFLKCGYF